jgi:hypothetical protein
MTIEPLLTIDRIEHPNSGLTPHCAIKSALMAVKIATNIAPNKTPIPVRRIVIGVEFFTFSLHWMKKKTDADSIAMIVGLFDGNSIIYLIFISPARIDLRTLTVGLAF